MTVRGALSTIAVLVALAAIGLARGAELRGTEHADRLVGTSQDDAIRGRGGDDRLEGRAGTDLLSGGPGRDTVLGQAGGDRIALHYDGARDRALCGAGADVVNADLQDVVSDDCEVVTRQLSRDPFSGIAQHETQVEPDSFSFGSTVVTAFQTGRLIDGGAVGIGWATSVDAGRTWRAGLLERVGDRVSDPSVAYDRRHRTWLVATLGTVVGPGTDAARLFVSRSPDGLSWSRPEPAAADPTEDYDKEWITCDNTPASRLYGRCYLAYLEAGTRELRVRRSLDGGRTWSSSVAVPVASAGERGNGAFPVVRPDGSLLVFWSVYGSMEPGDDGIMLTRSLDGAASFEQARRITPLFTEEIPGVRAPPFVSADVDASGTVYATWADCRFDPQCAANGVVMTTSRDGVSWTAVRPVPFGAVTAVVDRIVPAIAVEAGTAGSRARVAIVAYSVTQARGCRNCELVDAFLVASGDGGRTWRTAQRLNAESIPLEWVASTGLGRMLADYTSVSFVDGTPIAVVSLATEPQGGELRQAIFAVTRSRASR